MGDKLDETMLNSTELVNSTGFVFEELPSSIATVMRVISLVATVLNLVVIWCLRVNRPSLPAIYITQMICLATNDTLAGISSFIVSFLDASVITQNLSLCCGTMAFFIASQAATLYNITIICIKRLRVVQRVGEVQNDIEVRNTVMTISFVLLASYTLCGIPFLIWAQEDVFYTRNGCSLENAFGDNLNHATTLLFGTFLLPLLCTNIVYVFVAVSLHRAVKLNRWREKESSLAIRGPQRTQPQDSSYKNISIPSTSQTGGQCRPETEHVGPKDKLETRNQVNPTATERQAVRLKKAYGLLGLILLFLNLFSWPGIIVLLMETNLSSWSLTRSIKFPVFSTISWNTIVNPVLYTIRVKEFRIALVDMFQGYFNLVRRSCARR